MQKLLLECCHSENRAKAKSGKYFQIWFFPRFGGKNGVVLSMRMQVILDSSFARPGSVPIWGGKKGEFRDWTKCNYDVNTLQVGNLPPFYVEVLKEWQMTRDSIRSESSLHMK